MPFRLERLEDRVLMAASIRLHGGLLDVRGDNGDNGIVIGPGSEEGGLVYAAIDVNGNGEFNDSSDIVKVFDDDDVRRIRVNSAGGDDVILVALESDLVSDISVVTGSGDDVLRMQDMGIRSLTVNTGSGNDVAGLGFMFIDRNFVVSTGAGNDILSVSEVEVGGDLKISTAGGDDAISADDVSVQGRLKANLGGGDDFVSAGGIAVADLSKVNINGGGGRGDMIAFPQPGDLDIVEAAGAKIRNFELFETTTEPSELAEARMDLVFTRTNASLELTYELEQEFEDFLFPVP